DCLRGGLEIGRAQPEAQDHRVGRSRHRQGGGVLGDRPEGDGDGLPFPDLRRHLLLVVLDEPKAHVAQVEDARRRSAIGPREVGDELRQPEGVDLLARADDGERPPLAPLRGQPKLLEPHVVPDARPVRPAYGLDRARGIQFAAHLASRRAPRTMSDPRTDPSAGGPDVTAERTASSAAHRAPRSIRSWPTLAPRAPSGPTRGRRPPAWRLPRRQVWAFACAEAAASPSRPRRTVRRRASPGPSPRCPRVASRERRTRRGTRRSRRTTAVRRWVGRARGPALAARPRGRRSRRRASRAAGRTGPSRDRSRADCASRSRDAGGGARGLSRAVAGRLPTAPAARV